MKTHLYRRIAAGNLKKNGRFYIPHILTGAGLQACFYIILTLAMDDSIDRMRGGTFVRPFMVFGSLIMAALSLILMLYTNSFLMKQRRAEFGLYNILGMEKRHVGRILFGEGLISMVCSVGLGEVLGVLFYKLCSLLVCRILGMETVFGIDYIRYYSIVLAPLYFVLINVFTMIANRISIAWMKPIELLRDAHTGEKEPRIKVLLLIVGLAALAAGYYIAITTDSPLQALELFFAAVLLVIIGTYFLFVSGSIAILKALKRNSSYYYQKDHMVAVSGLMYRMKQNAVGLASITILATGVLVMISTTVSLYAGIGRTLERNFPQTLYYEAYVRGEDMLHLSPIEEEVVASALMTAAQDHGLAIEEIEKQHYYESTYYFEDGTLRSGTQYLDEANAANFTFLTEAEYTAMTGETIGLADGEIALCGMSGNTGYDGAGLVIDGAEYRIAERILYFPISAKYAGFLDCYGIVLPGEEDFLRLYEAQNANYGQYGSGITDRYAVTLKDAEQIDFETGEGMKEEAFAILSKAAAAEDPEASLVVQTDSRWETKEHLYAMNGSLLFLGLLLGFVFIFATALIIYYKQISEGFEDRARFQILEKIGMSSDEVRSTIRSQILLVFFLPLVTAGCHIIFAFPILNKMLQVLMLSDKKLFAVGTAGTFAAFVLIYIGLYRMTAKAYYRIVH